MGSDVHYPEEAPAHRVRVGSLFIDPYPVTNRQFAAFVAATGYRTIAERRPKPADYPGALPQMLKPGSLVFRKTRGPVDLRDVRNWWAWTPGAYWRHPEGKGSSVAGDREEPPYSIVPWYQPFKAGNALPLLEKSGVVDRWFPAFAGTTTGNFLFRGGDGLRH